MWIRIRFEIVCFCLAWQMHAFAQDDPMGMYRDRFQAGYEKFQQGAMGEALAYWEPIYRELGPEKGWVVAYDIALVYDALGDPTRAAEHYESFLEQVKIRREKGETLEERFLKEEEKARANLDALIKSRGRIRIPATTPAQTVQIDHVEPRIAGFVAFVAPGHHTVVFAPGTKEEDRHEIDVAGGEIATVEMIVKPPPPVPLPMTRVESVERPYSAAWIVTLGSLAVLSAAAPITCYAVAISQLDSIRKQQNTQIAQQIPIDEQNAQINAYQATRTAAYLTLPIPFVLAAGTAALAIGWAYGTKRTVTLVPQAGGMSAIATF